MDFSGFEDIYKDIDLTDEEVQEDIAEQTPENNRTQEFLKNIDLKTLQQEVFYKEKNSVKNSSKNNFHSGHRQRARERFLSNPDAISDYDLLELFLFLVIPRVDVKPLARKLLDEYKTFNKFFNSSRESLNKNGINGDVVKYLFTLFSVIQKRVLRQQMNDQLVINNINVLVNYCQSCIADKQEEQFRVIFFNSKFKVIDDVYFGLSNVSSVTISCKDILEKCLELKASNVVLYHNHPGQDVTPSKSDIETTEEVIKSLSIINVNVVDHIIVSGDKWFSFKQETLI